MVDSSVKVKKDVLPGTRSLPLQGARFGDVEGSMLLSGYGNLRFHRGMKRFRTIGPRTLPGKLQVKSMPVRFVSKCCG